MTDVFEPDEVAEAERLDAEISRALAGDLPPGADPIVPWVLAAVRSDPPPGLGARIEDEHEAQERARWRPVQLVAALFALNLLSHGFGNMFVGDWVARGLGEHYSPHAVREGGIALIAVGLAVGAGWFRRSWLPVSVATGAPLGIVLGIYGAPEVTRFGPGAALHVFQGTLGIALLVLWWRARRYGRAPRAEGET